MEDKDIQIHIIRPNLCKLTGFWLFIWQNEFNIFVLPPRGTYLIKIIFFTINSSFWWKRKVFIYLLQEKNHSWRIFHRNNGKKRVLNVFFVIRLFESYAWFGACWPFLFTYDSVAKKCRKSSLSFSWTNSNENQNFFTWFNIRMGISFLSFSANLKRKSTQSSNCTTAEFVVVDGSNFWWD